MCRIDTEARSHSNGGKLTGIPAPDDIDAPLFCIDSTNLAIGLVILSSRRDAL